MAGNNNNNPINPGYKYIDYDLQAGWNYISFPFQLSSSAAYPEDLSAAFNHQVRAIEDVYGDSVYSADGYSFYGGLYGGTYLRPERGYKIYLADAVAVRVTEDPSAGVGEYYIPVAIDLMHGFTPGFFGENIYGWWLDTPHWIASPLFSNYSAGTYTPNTVFKPAGRDRINNYWDNQWYDFFGKITNLNNTLETEWVNEEWETGLGKLLTIEPGECYQFDWATGPDSYYNSDTSSSMYFRATIYNDSLSGLSSDYGIESQELLEGGEDYDDDYEDDNFTASGTEVSFIKINNIYKADGVTPVGAGEVSILHDKGEPQSGGAAGPFLPQVRGVITWYDGRFNIPLDPDETNIIQNYNVSPERSMAYSTYSDVFHIWLHRGNIEHCHPEAIEGTFYTHPHPNPAGGLQPWNNDSAFYWARDGIVSHKIPAYLPAQESGQDWWNNGTYNEMSVEDEAEYGKNPDLSIYFKQPIGTFYSDNGCKNANLYDAPAIFPIRSLDRNVEIEYNGVFETTGTIHNRSLKYLDSPANIKFLVKVDYTDITSVASSSSGNNAVITAGDDNLDGQHYLCTAYDSNDDVITSNTIAQYYIDNPEYDPEVDFYEIEKLVVDSSWPE